MLDKLQVKLSRLKSHYPFLFPLNLGDSKNEIKSKVKEKLSEIDVTRNICVLNPKDDLKIVSLYSLLKLRRYIDCEFMNAYRLLNVYLGLDETFVSLQDIDVELSIIYFGYAEMENKRQGEILCQFIEQQIVKNRLVWLYFKGNRDALSSKYPEVNLEIQSRDIQVVDFNASRSEDIDDF